ncbi:MAG: hypothetical protein QOI55_648, partial [Actinomycetota bacterium]|nr:hypothetical protein [Actinomycetota bacterium]
MDEVETRNEMAAVPSTTPSADEEPAATAPPTPRFGYNPALDGIRAFAILAVLGFHYTFRRRLLMPGGYLGVDAFFVLSGFLITTLLLAEHSRKSRISLRAFYARRALRLLPLLAVVLVVAIIVNIVASPLSEGRPSRQAITAAAFYYANWFHLRPAGSELGFLAATWSLSIEEQFYLVWPLLFIGMLRVGLRKGTLFAVTLAAAAASALWRLYLVTNHPTKKSFVDFYVLLTGQLPRRVQSIAEGSHGDRVYFGSDTRADMLLVGCALAILLMWLGPRVTPLARRIVNVLGVVSAVVALWFMY